MLLMHSLLIMDKVEYDIICLGAGRVGGVLIKELCRFLSCFKDGNANLFIIDDADVSEKDVLSETFVRDDIGWNKAACMAEAVIDNLDLGRTDNEMPALVRKVYAYSIHACEDTVSRIASVINEHGYTYNVQKIMIVVNCTNGDKDASDAINRLFETKDSIIVLNPDGSSVTCAVKTFGVISIPLKVPEQKFIYEDSMAVNMAHMILTELVQIISAKNTVIQTRCLDDIREDKDNRICLDAKNKRKMIVCVGTGGTGGDFVKEISKKLLLRDDTLLLLIDGDRVENKNCTRQPFSHEDIQQNKASVLRQGLINDYPELEGKIYTHPHYIDKVDDLENAVNAVAKDCFVYLIGCVDNHRARQVMHMYYALHDDVLYIDSANEFEYGEVVVSVKKNGIQYSPSRAFYFRDVLTDDSPSASEQSCGVINISSPQHQVTNLYAAGIIYTAVEMALEKDEVNGGIVYFDVFQYMRRFQAVGKEVLKS